MLAAIRRASSAVNVLAWMASVRLAREYTKAIACPLASRTMKGQAQLRGVGSLYVKRSHSPSLELWAKVGDG
jgi:hypothetical protein